MICRRQVICQNNGCNEKAIPEHYKQHLVEKIYNSITLNSPFPVDYRMGRRSKDEISKTGFGGRGGAHHLPPPPRLQSVLLPWSSLAGLSQKAKHLSWSNKGQVFSMFDFHYVCVWGSFASTKFINICANFDFMLRFVTDSPQFGVTNFPETEF